MMNEKGVEMLNLFKRPFEKDTLEDWGKLSIDIAKVAILAMPVVLYGESAIPIKIANVLFLTGGAYCSLIIGRKFRAMKEGVS